MNVGEGAIDQSAEHVVIGHRKLRGSIRSRCSSRSSSLFRNDPAHINTRKFPIDPPATLNLEAPKSSVYGLTLASGHIRAGMVTHADLAALHEPGGCRRCGGESLDIVQYLPCAARPDGAEAREIAKEAVGEMLIALWPTATTGRRSAKRSSG
jgi:hypothetical protein